jgi:hypothetical protein
MGGKRESMNLSPRFKKRRRGGKMRLLVGFVNSVKDFGVPKVERKRRLVIFAPLVLGSPSVNTDSENILSLPLLLAKNTSSSLTSILRLVVLLLYNVN